MTPCFKREILNAGREQCDLLGGGVEYSHRLCQCTCVTHLQSCGPVQNHGTGIRLGLEGLNLQFSCIGCGNGVSEPVRAYRTNTQSGAETFGRPVLHECKKCSLVQVWPPPAPEALERYYVEDYRRSGLYGADVACPARFPKDNLFYFNRGNSIAELVSAHVQGDAPRVLDIGAGYGHILHAIGQRFSKAQLQAIEFSAPCVAHLESIGIEVHSQPAERILPKMEGQFDLLIMSHALEHILRPKELLELVEQSLAPGGVLYVEVPNIPRETLTKYPDHPWAPRYDEPHITFFSARTLRSLGSSSGFIELFCDSAGPEYRSISAIRYSMPPAKSSLLNLLPRSIFDFLRRQQFTKGARVQEREETFYKYGGFRIWLRSIWRKPAAS